MKTDALITMLASGDVSTDAHAGKKRFAMALLVAAVGALLLAIGWLGIRPDIARAAATPLFWIKAALPASLMVGALWATSRLARPGVRAGASRFAIGVPVAAVWLGAAWLLLAAAPEDRLALVLGSSWRVCPVLIATLSLPGFVAIFRALRGLAPTRPRCAGAAAGLLAGATATLAYCVHCPEMGVPFWAVWYVLGMSIPTLCGMMLGPRLLRW